jgi:Leucine-rich repeat (LRR) protein
MNPTNPNIQRIIKDINEGTFTTNRIDLSGRDGAYTEVDFAALVDVFKKHQDLANKIEFFALRDVEFKDGILDLSVFTKLKRLRLERCHLSNMPIASSLLECETLQIISTKFDKEPTLDFSGFNKLKNIEISACNLEHFPIMNSCKNLEKLSLTEVRFNDNNTLDFSGLVNLKELDLRDCVLKSLPSTIATCVNLEWLSLEKNPFTGLLKLPALKKLRGLIFEKCGLIDLPNFSECTQLEVINLANNSLQKIPNLAALPKLQVLGLRGNPISKEALAKINKLQKNRTGLRIIFDPSKEGYLSDEALNSETLEELLTLFVKYIDHQTKDETTIPDLNKIANAFLARLKQQLETDEAKSFLTKCREDSMFQSQCRFMLHYLDDILHEKLGELRGIKELSMNILVKHLTSDDVWLPDMSFLSGLLPEQTTIGKPREVSPFPKGLLVSCSLGSWKRDLKSHVQTKDVHYYTPAEKKSIKARLTQEPYVLKRNIDETQKIPDGHYLYALSLNGGLLVGREAAPSGSGAQHSTFRAGQYVICAGHLTIENGKIVEISNNSGHYTPPEINLYCTAAYLYKNGLINKDCKIPIHSDTTSHLTVGAMLENLQEYIKDDSIRKFIEEMPCSSKITNPSAEPVHLTKNGM